MVQGIYQRMAQWCIIIGRSVPEWQEMPDKMTGGSEFRRIEFMCKIVYFCNVNDLCYDLNIKKHLTRCNLCRIIIGGRGNDMDACMSGHCGLS